VNPESSPRSEQSSATLVSHGREPSRFLHEQPKTRPTGGISRYRPKRVPRTISAGGSSPAWNNSTTGEEIDRVLQSDPFLPF